jgi:hypothetical protein
MDTQLNRIWRARGVFPGLGSALSAFGYEWGFQHGMLLAHELGLMARHVVTRPGFCQGFCHLQTAVETAQSSGM